MVEKVLMEDNFKSTDVGIIPIDWDAKKLNELGETIIGLTYKPENVKNNGLLVLRSSNINGCYLNYKDNVYVDVNVKDKLLVKENDVLICVRNGSRELIGKCALINKEAEGSTFGAFMSIFRSDLGQYIYYNLQSNKVKKQINEHLGATINQITNKSLKSFSIPIPGERREVDLIVNVLSDIDDLILSLEKLIDKKKLIKQGAMEELLTGKRRLDGFDGEWANVVLGTVLKFQTGFPFKSEYFNQNGNGIRLIKNRDLKNDDQVYYYSGEYMKEYVVNNGDVLVSMDGDFAPCLWGKGKSLLNQRVGRIIGLGYIDINFIRYTLIKPLEEIQRGTCATTVKHLSHNDIESIDICIPINLEEQETIANILSDMDKEIETLEKKLDKYKKIKNGMMEELLTGKRRLI